MRPYSIACKFHNFEALAVSDAGLREDEAEAW